MSTTHTQASLPVFTFVTTVGQAPFEGHLLSSCVEPHRPLTFDLSQKGQTNRVFHHTPFKYLQAIALYQTFLYRACVDQLTILPYIKLIFTHHVFSTNSSLKLCMEPTLVNFSGKIQVRAEIYIICKNVSYLSDCIFHRFLTLTNIAGNG